VLVFLLVLTHQGYILFQMNTDIPSITLPVPVGIATVSLPIMALLMIYYNIRHIVARIRNGFSARVPASDSF
jgi:TRAP-type C4-dicarboxylate transport system permease small subunit